MFIIYNAPLDSQWSVKRRRWGISNSRQTSNVKAGSSKGRANCFII